MLIEMFYLYWHMATFTMMTNCSPNLKYYSHLLWSKRGTRSHFRHVHQAKNCSREQKYCRQQIPLTYWKRDKWAFTAKIKTFEICYLAKIIDNFYSGDRPHTLQNFPEIIWSSILSTSCKHLLGDVIKCRQLDGISCHPDMQLLKQ